MIYDFSPVTDARTTQQRVSSLSALVGEVVFAEGADFSFGLTSGSTHMKKRLFSAYPSREVNQFRVWKNDQTDFVELWVSPKYSDFFVNTIENGHVFDFLAWPASVSAALHITITALQF